jgi:hypothetical protein
LSVLAESSKAGKKEAPVAAVEAISVLPGYMGAVDFEAGKMDIRDALQAAAYWDAAGFTDPGFFKPPQ